MRNQLNTLINITFEAVYTAICWLNGRDFELHSNSNLAGRLARYNAHMWRARALETMNVGGVK